MQMKQQMDDAETRAKRSDDKKQHEIDKLNAALIMLEIMKCEEFAQLKIQSQEKITSLESTVVSTNWAVKQIEAQMEQLKVSTYMYSMLVQLFQVLT